MEVNENLGWERWWVSLCCSQSEGSRWKEEKTIWYDCVSYNMPLLTSYSAWTGKPHYQCIIRYLNWPWSKQTARYEEEIRHAPYTPNWTRLYFILASWESSSETKLFDFQKVFYAYWSKGKGTNGGHLGLCCCTPLVWFVLIVLVSSVAHSRGDLVWLFIRKKPFLRSFKQFW